MNGHLFALLGALVTLAFMFELLRRRRLREKYAGFWIVTALVVLVAAVFPGITEWLATLVGITTPVNLIFFLGLLVLLVVCVQISAEVSELEHENQALAEQTALLRLRLERLERAVEDAGVREVSPIPDVDGDAR
ncbi:DUF2304 domain-containing protein [Cellulomonas xiejunii]|uniref:DUF2304 domain-containing protein n=1 Tax=Cellulomonas xiejunii TaxID=2968083 RepID=A0ABY5KJ52_9CELL|nr:DUF2304 domain-containing protein [Cellulomonas xiejunii]MCC2312935.1 DUF2304 domain-containing protein [Cellulomonas xiejunii]MCC2320195.1 DUF2304 domain-containing protein [Cellulomonas xiejunii]UUI70502.1 DUF2304 domain-containing protein [Cellulomonas xiejunii]